MNLDNRISRPSERPDPHWDDAPLDRLIDHLLVAYHRPLDEDLPRIDALACKVRDVHGGSVSEDLEGIAATFSALRDELELHMMKEERVLFPLIRGGRGRDAGAPIEVMRHEHDNAFAALKQLRKLANHYVIPEGACGSWQSLWLSLEEFERSLLEHIRLENEILFPRAAGPAQDPVRRL